MNNKWHRFNIKDKRTYPNMDLQNEFLVLFTAPCGEFAVTSAWFYGDEGWCSDEFYDEDAIAWTDMMYPEIPKRYYKFLNRKEK